MSILFSLLLVALCSSPAAAVSSGEVGFCDAVSASWGCTTWNQDDAGADNRLSCSMTTAASQLMPWVAAAVRSPHYTLRSSDDGGDAAADPKT